MSIFTLAISCLATSNLPWFMDLTFQVSLQHCSLQHHTLLPSPVTPTIGCCFSLAPSLHSFWSYFSTYRAPLTCGFHLSGFYLFAFSYSSWGFQGKNTEMACHYLFQWTTFCQNSPPRPVRLGWPNTAWLSFIELDKIVIHLISLVGLLWLWFSFCLPSDGYG